MFVSFTRIAALACLLSACSSSPAPVPASTPGGDAQPVSGVEQAGLTLELHASADLNPGASGQPAPVRVRIFELKNTAAFARADYFALAERAGQTLGADLVDQDEVLIRPGETRSVVRTLNPATRYVGLVVGYREIDRARWRTLLNVAPRQEQQYRIDLDAQAVSSQDAAATRPAQ